MKGGVLHRLLVSKLCVGLLVVLIVPIVVLLLEGAPVLTIFGTAPEQVKVFSQGFLQQLGLEHLGDNVSALVGPAGPAYNNHTQRSITRRNKGHHWNRGKFGGNHWGLYAHGKPTGKGRFADLNHAKNHTLYSIARWVDSEHRPQMKVFLRTMSPRHFVNGDWNTGGSCGNTVPLSNGSEVLQDHSSDLSAELAVNGTRVKLLDITAISQL